MSDTTMMLPAGETEKPLTRRAMTGAELKVQLTGLGLSPAWLADRLKVTTRTVIRWFDVDRVPVRVAAEIDAMSLFTSLEINRIVSTAEENGGIVIYTQRTGQGVGGVRNPNTLPASWHRAVTFRALERIRSSGADATVAYLS